MCYLRQDCQEGSLRRGYFSRGLNEMRDQVRQTYEGRTFQLEQEQVQSPWNRSTLAFPVWLKLNEGGGEMPDIG